MNLEDNNLMFGKLFFFSRVMAMDKVYITTEVSMAFYLSLVCSYCIMLCLVDVENGYFEEKLCVH